MRTPQARFRKARIQKAAPQPGSTRPCAYVSLHTDTTEVGVTLDIPPLQDKSPDQIRRHLVREALRQIMRMPEHRHQS